MVDGTKITLSQEELQLVCDTNWILTKRMVIDKVYALFGALAANYALHVENDTLMAQQVTIPAKISKGENYLQLPYVVLDFPRQYDVTNTLAIRTMFWWGNFFSITLHVTGKYKTTVAKNILQHLPELRQKGLFICNSKDQWHHHFGKDNYVPLHEKSSEEMAAMFIEKEFIKVAAKFPLQQWQDVPLSLQDIFSKMLWLLKD